MRLHLLTKCPVGLEAPIVVGCFTDRELARKQINGPGTWTIFSVEANKPYAEGNLLDVETMIVTDPVALGTIPVSPRYADPIPKFLPPR